MRGSDGTAALERVRAMRHAPTEAERLLWRHLRGRGLAGAKFRRQHWLGAYIADFICLEACLIVEVDGAGHADRAVYDARRDATLAAAGYRTLRFGNGDVLTNMAGTLEAIRIALGARTGIAMREVAPLPSPSHRPPGGGPLPLPMGEAV